MKISVHAIPHQSFLSIGSEVPIAKKSSFPPGEAKGASTNSPWISLMVFRVPPETPPTLRRQLSSA